MQTVTFDRPLELECGRTLRDVTVAYDTYGKLSPTGDNVVWVCHALTSSSDVADWWPHTVERGRFLDPEKYFVVCANILGSCYGTTGPLSVNPDTGQPYYADFPPVTIRDQVECHRRLARHLGITGLHALIGSSMGGYQALEWAVTDPEMPRRLIVIASGSHSRPWLLAFNASMLMALEADQTYGLPRPDAGAAGLACARSIGLISYRGRVAYDLTQADREPMPLFRHRAASYQRYQGQKLVNRFNAYSYAAICGTVDSHDLARGRQLQGETLDQARARVMAAIRARTLIVGIDSDLIFPPSDMDDMAQNIPQARMETIQSPFAHDGFLVEHQALDTLISGFYQEPHT